MVEERYDRKRMFDKRSKINAERRNLEVYDRIKNYETILDIGCGLGYFAQLIESDPNIKSYVGLDYNPDIINRAKKQIEAEHFNFFVFDLREQSILNIDSRFKPVTIVCTELIEHIDKAYQIKLLTDIKAMFDETGYGMFIGTTPMQPHEGPNPSGNHYHVWEHTFESFEKMIRSIFKEEYNVNLQRRYDYGDTIFFEVIKK